MEVEVDMDLQVEEVEEDMDPTDHLVPGVMMEMVLGNLLHVRE